MEATGKMWWSLFRRTSAERPPPTPGEETAEATEAVEAVDEDATLIRKVAERIVGMRMTVPAIFFLESSKPLAFLGSQLLIFLEPFVQTLFNFRQYQRFAFLMEDRTNWESLIRKVEELEAEHTEKEKQAKLEKKAKKQKKK
jgi:hypothetical protein